MGCRLRAATARAWVDRGAHGRDRISLGGRTQRALPRDRGRVGCPFQNSIRLGIRIVFLTTFNSALSRCAEPPHSPASIAPRSWPVYINGDPLMNLQRLRINIFALAARLPTMLPQREYLDLGEISGWLRDVGFERGWANPPAATL